MKEHYYLDNASTSWPKPEPVYCAMDRLARSHAVNPGRGNYALAFEADRWVWETRELLGEFFGHRGGPDHVIFTHNATDSLNMALLGVLEEGNHVVTTRLEHNSVLRPLHELQRSRNVAMTLVGRDGEGFVDPADIRRAITPRTKAIILNHASNVLGTVQLAAEIGRVAREAGVLFVLDASQSAGVVEIDVEGCNVDLLAFAGHKGLYGPMGIGGLIVRPGTALAPLRFGGTGTNSRVLEHAEDYPHRLEAGTLPLPAILGLNAAQKWFAELGRGQSSDGSPSMTHRQACQAALQQIACRHARHRDRLLEAFRTIKGVTIYGPRAGNRTIGVLSINLSGLNAEDAAGLLDADFAVCVRPGLHCAPLVHVDEGTIDRHGAVRISTSFLSEDGDVDEAISGVAELACRF